MKCTLVGRPISKDAQANPVLPLHFHAQAHTRGNGHTSCYDTVCPEIARSHIGDMHRAPATATNSCFLAKQLGHHKGEIRALGNAVPMSAMFAGNVIIASERTYCTYCCSFLPDGQMSRPVHFAAHK